MTKEGKYTCGVCKTYKTDTIRGLGIHLSKGHNIRDTEEYYNTMKMGEVINCFFCGEKGKYINLSIGYRNLCESKECLSKVYATHTIESIMFSNNCNEEEAEKIRTDRLLAGASANKETIQKRLIDNPNFLKEKSHNSKEYWIKRGSTEEEAIIQSTEVMNDIHKKFSDKRKDNPEYYKDSYNMNKEFWTKRGFTEEETLIKIKERQTTFSKEICIEKHGEEEGLKVWQERQDKWQKTLDDKTEEEKILINKSKIPKTRSGGSVSKVSSELFNLIPNVWYHEYKYGKEELYIRGKHGNYFLDFVDMTTKKCIEFNGDYWHCNPEKFNEDYKHKMGLSAKEIWDKDDNRFNDIKEEGFQLLVIWELEFTKDREATLNKCIEFLNN